jgi:hypothetical protein
MRFAKYEEPCRFSPISGALGILAFIGSGGQAGCGDCADSPDVGEVDTQCDVTHRGDQNGLVALTVKAECLVRLRIGWEGSLWKPVHSRDFK